MLQSEEVRKKIRIAALLNAISHNGKAELGAVMARVLAENPELRRQARELTDLAKQVIAEVNLLDVNAQIDQLEPGMLEEERRKKEQERREEREQQQKKTLPPLPNADKYREIRTRFAPNPDSVLHLGSTRAIILSHDYARMYSGKFILRFEDTDPRLKKPAFERMDPYESIKEDLEWLLCNPDEIYYQSDRLEIYYQYAEELIRRGGAYICTCKRERFREYVARMQPCPCRALSTDEHLKRWRMMLSGEYDEGEAVMRVKTDLTHPNPAVRDWPAMRIIDTSKYKHPRVGSKYRVWPLYNWSAGIDDHLMGVTHIIRGQEHATNAVRQIYFYKAFGWEYPEAIHYGRLKIENAELSKSKIEQGIREKKYEDYDDPRLATLKALKRRGIRPEAIRRLIIDIGPKKIDVKISWENIYALNRQLIDPVAPRHTAIFEPTLLQVYGVPDESIQAELPLHPDRPEMGKRIYSLSKESGVYRFLVPKEELVVGSRIRLMGLMNVQVEKESEAKFLSYSMEDARSWNAKAVQWLPELQHIDISVKMQNAEEKEGKGDIYLLKEEVDTVVQLERLFFARVDRKQEEEKKKVWLYFTSK